MKTSALALCLLTLVPLGGVLAAAAKPVETVVEGAGFSFTYRYPQTVTQFPALQRQLDKDKIAQLTELKGWARDWVKDNPYKDSSVKLESDVDWAVVTNLPDYLSLTSDYWSFTGGAHGNFGRSALVWDKRAGLSRDATDFFTSKAAFDAIVQTRYCDLLDAERSKRRDGEAIDRSQSDDWMQACPKPSELMVILGSSNGKTFNRLAVYAAPYAVGPYVEGEYEINLPMTAALVAAVRPQFRTAFSETPGAK